MKLSAVLGIGVVVALAGTARAEDQAPGQPAPLPKIITGTIPVDPSLVDAIPRDQIDPANPPSRIIYLNRCANGCTVRPGFDSSINQTSAVLSQTANLSPFMWGDTAWNNLVSCMQTVYAPFNVTVTDQDPGNVNHWEEFVAGTTYESGLTCDNTQGCILGVAAGDNRCPQPVHNNAVVFDFVDTTPYFNGNINEMCWVAAQEVAHAFGLDHEALAEDPMTYIGLNGPYNLHTFHNQNAPCGANSHLDSGCFCPSTDDPQNSYQEVMNVFGPSGPVNPPTVTITQPANNATVTPGFEVLANITDDHGIQSANLTIDGTVVGTKETAPWAWLAPSTLSPGTHIVAVNAMNVLGGAASAQVTVSIGGGCQSAADCANQGSNLTCVGGRCVPDSGTPGGLGSTCMNGSDCASGQCWSGTSGSYCIEYCNPTANDCPSGFSCITPTGSQQSGCWPENGTSGGCEATGADVPTLPIGVGLALGAVLIGSRRRRARARA